MERRAKIKSKPDAVIFIVSAAIVEGQMLAVEVCDAGAKVVLLGQMPAIGGTSATANVFSFISRDNTILPSENGKRFVNEKDIGYMTQKLNNPVLDQMHRDGTVIPGLFTSKAAQHQEQSQ